MKFLWHRSSTITKKQGTIILYILLAITMLTSCTSLPFFQASQTHVGIQPDRAKAPEVSQADLEMTTYILFSRWLSLGYKANQISFKISEDGNYITGSLPGNIDGMFIDRTKAIGLVEFVDLGSKYLQPGTIVNTDYDHAYLPTSTGNTYHTILTNSEIDTATVTEGQNNDYQVEFSLTDEGRQIFAGYTSQNVGSYVGIVVDKVAISSPNINAPILDGKGVIMGNFDKDSARILAALMQHPPLPIPLQ